jgi:hypothetical protein
MDARDHDCFDVEHVRSAGQTLADHGWQTEGEEWQPIQL